MKTDQDIDRQRQHFESVSDFYFKSRQHRNHLKLKDLIWNFSLGGLQLPSAPVILEPMCGYSEGRKILSPFTNTERYEGFDFSLPLVQEAKQQSPNTLIWHADITKVDLEPAKYDIVILIGGLHHVPKYLDLSLEKVYSALKPGGVFINLEPTQNFFLLKKVREIIYSRNKLFDEQTERAFDLSELNAAFYKAKFKIDRQVYPGLLSYILFYNPDAFPLLNVGSPQLVERIFNLEKPLFTRWPGRIFSFATLSVLRK
jgi:SAM-dependent methyltransferase